MENNLTMNESFALDKKEDDETRLEEEKIFPAGSNSSQAKLNLGVTILASRFAAILGEELKRSKMLRCHNYKNQKNLTFLLSLMMTNRLHYDRVYWLSFSTWGQKFSV